jgi:methylglyoxal reductase
MSREVPAARPGRRMLAGSLDVHPVGIGCWAIGGPDDNLGMPMGWSTASDGEALRGLEAACDLGANLFDTADVYGHGHSERLLGHLIRSAGRDRLVLSSKTGYFKGTAAHPYLPSAMRRQLETTLENLGTDHLDIYAFHNSEFGPGDRYLDSAVAQMRAFQKEGLIRAVGMRGPHRFAPDRRALAKGQREDKHARFRRLFEVIRPDCLAVRFNALTPAHDGPDGIFAFAAAHGASVLINKPLAQGLLTGKHDPDRPPALGPGDHRLRKAWFTPPALAILRDGLQPLRDRYGPEHLAPVMIAYCLAQSPDAVVLAGFTTARQVTQNLTPPATPLADEDITFIRAVGTAVQERLDAAGEVFLDEAGANA